MEQLIVYVSSIWYLEGIPDNKLSKNEASLRVFVHRKWRKLSLIGGDETILTWFFRFWKLKAILPVELLELGQSRDLQQCSDLHIGRKPVLKKEQLWIKDRLESNGKTFNSVKCHAWYSLGRSWLSTTSSLKSSLTLSVKCYTWYTMVRHFSLQRPHPNHC